MGRREFELMSIQQIDDDEAIRLHGKWQLFTMATYRKRLAVAFFVIFSAQNTGVLVINSTFPLPSYNLSVVTLVYQTTRFLYTARWGFQMLNLLLSQLAGSLGHV